MNNNDLQVLENRLSLHQTKFEIALVIMDSLNCWDLFYESCYDDITDFLWQEYNITVSDNLHVLISEPCGERIRCHLDFYFRRHFDFDIPIDFI